VSGGRNAFDVARRGAVSIAQAAHAFVLLRMQVAAALDPRTTAALADADVLLDRPLATSDEEGPYRSRTPVGVEMPPLLASYELAPDACHGFGATLLASCSLFLGVVLVAPSPVLKCFCQGKGDIALTGVKKLAFESYPQWASRPANRDRCPTVQQLAEYGGSVKDPWGETYRVRCHDLPPGAVGIAVWSTGEDRRDGTADDVQSWAVH
jgi:hypothetical protein